MYILCGNVVGRKKGIKNDKGKTYSTLQIEVAPNQYEYAVYEESLIPSLKKDQEITLLVSVSSNLYQGKATKRVFVTAFISDQKIINPSDFLAERTFSSWDEF